MPNTNKHDRPDQVSRQQGVVPPPQSGRPTLAKLLDEWMQEDETEQRETFEVLRRSLDEDRPEGYKLFS